MNNSKNPVLTILAVLGLLFSLTIILFIDVDSFEMVKKLSYSWLAVIGGILALFGGFYFMLNRK